MHRSTLTIALLRLGYDLGQMMYLARAYLDDLCEVGETRDEEQSHHEQNDLNGNSPSMEKEAKVYGMVSEDRFRKLFHPRP